MQTVQMLCTAPSLTLYCTAWYLAWLADGVLRCGSSSHALLARDPVGAKVAGCKSTAQNFGVMAEAHGFLPAPALERVATYLLSGTDSQTGLLSLMALAGVDRYTRTVVSRLHSEHAVAFDALEGCSHKTLGRSLLPRELSFARSSADVKTAFFLSAARLFGGYGEVAFGGQGSTDLLLLEVARKVQHGLVALRLQVSYVFMRCADHLLLASRISTARSRLSSSLWQTRCSVNHRLAHFESYVQVQLQLISHWNARALVCELRSNSWCL